MFEVQFRAKEGHNGRWSTHWTTDCPQDAGDHLRQMSVSVTSAEWRMVWTTRGQVPSSQRMTKLQMSA